MPSEPTEIMSPSPSRLGLQSGAEPTLQQLADANPEIMRRLSRLDPFQAATAFGGLLTFPELQGNCFRIEPLVHLALMAAEGQGTPADSFIRFAFRALGDGFCGRMEDPPEDVFVGTVRTPRGNFRVLGGIWEGNAFYLQRFLNIVEAMPDGPGYDDLRDAIYALLTLSDLVCERAGLERHQLGAVVPALRLSTKALGLLGTKARRIRFTITELAQAGISPAQLAPFLFTPNDRHLLAAQKVGFSSLERRPLIRTQDHISLVLPTATSAAIRYHVIERLDTAGMRAALGRAIANEYTQHFSDVPLLGGRRGTPISFRTTDQGAVASVISTVDTGRYLHAIFFTDNLADFDQEGLAGFNNCSDFVGSAITSYVTNAYGTASTQADFVDGITLVVNCGVGRGFLLPFEQPDHPNWTIEFISAYDLDTLSWTPRFQPLSLWRLLAAAQRVEQLGINLQNVSGLLNLAAWARSLDGHIVPHSDLPDDFGSDDSGAFLMVQQNMQRDLRHEVAIHHDARAVRDMRGRWIPVRRDHESMFADDEAAPLYASEIANDEGWLMSVYLAPARAWWAEASVPDDTPRAIAFERWRMIATWLRRAVPKLDQLPRLPAGPVKWRAVFEAASGGLRGQGPERSYEEARAGITVTIDRATATVTTTASPAFEDAIYHPENIAERALVDAILEGVLALAGASQDDRPTLLGSVVTSPLARQTHGFAARTVRHFVHHRLGRHVIKIDADDDAAIRLGLGWSIRNRTLGGQLSGKEETIAYLKTLVAAIEDKLCEDLGAFNQEALLKRVLLNHETAASDRDRWRLSSAALLALHPDTDSTLAIIGNHEMELSAVFQASRVLMEIAICESPVDGGREPGDLDLSRLMAKAILIFHMGGWTDAILWDVMEPTIRITALGDVHAKFDYVADVIAPHARETSNVRTREAADDYAENLKQPEGTMSASGVVDQLFLDAWEEEYGTTLEDMRMFVDWLESRSIEREEPVMCLMRADFENVAAKGIVLLPEVVTKLLDRMTLPGRLKWRDVPAEFDDRDRQPWRYRRRLSVMRRPILKVGLGRTERYMVAPGMVRDSFKYLFANYIRGDFPSHQLSPKMRSWAAREADARGKAFTKEVAEVLRKLGWEAECEVKLTKIFGHGLDRDYGDVDVLAWRPDERRILIIECKDVQFKKTYGEICEQLADFRGELRGNGKPDYLLLHLNRMDILNENLGKVRSYLKLKAADTILESRLVFRNPVPMKYALKRLSERVTVSLFDEIPSWAQHVDAI